MGDHFRPAPWRFTPTAMHEPRTAAKTMLVEAGHAGLALTNLKLQKLLYLAHGLMLARHGRPLVNETFKAWKYGPVLESLYHRIKVFGTDAMSADDPFIKPWPELPADAADARRAIVDVLAQFGRMSSSGLVNLSHAPQGPWERVYTADTASSEISDESIEDYFRQYLVDAA
jgi:uncharacterized phage-associated protein